MGWDGGHSITNHRASWSDWQACVDATFDGGPLPVHSTARSATPRLVAGADRVAGGSTNACVHARRMFVLRTAAARPPIRGGPSGTGIAGGHHVREARHVRKSDPRRVRRCASSAARSATAQPDRAPVPEPPLPPAALPTMPPPDPTARPEGCAAATAGRAPRVPSMFPEPVRRRPRRSWPTWSVVSGAVVLVIAMAVAAVRPYGWRMTAVDTSRRNGTRVVTSRGAQADVARLYVTTLTRAVLGTAADRDRAPRPRTRQAGDGATPVRMCRPQSVAMLGGAREFADRSSPQE